MSEDENALHQDHEHTALPCVCLSAVVAKAKLSPAQTEPECLLFPFPAPSHLLGLKLQGRTYSAPPNPPHTSADDDVCSAVNASFVFKVNVEAATTKYLPD